MAYPRRQMNHPNRHDSNERWAEFEASGSFFDCLYCRKPVHENEVQWIKIHHAANWSEPAQIVEEPMHPECVAKYFDREDE